MENQNYSDKGGYPPAQGGYPPAQGGYPPAQGGYQPTQGYPSQPPPAAHVTVTQPTTQVVVVGNCPVCHAGTLMDQFTACGIILAIVFFPLGVICCLMMKERVCTNCGAQFGG